jgi:SAM-dependent methyltransferase
MEPSLALPPCNVCGAVEFRHADVIWPELAAQWGLSEGERGYINVQQGTCCTSCGSNVRSIALAEAILRYYQSPLTLKEWVRAPTARQLQVLEVNEAGSLSNVLRELPGRHLVTYPDYDMMALDLDSGSYDVVVHSDTFEHVPDPLKALRECRRILRSGGVCLFTVPIITGRLTRLRHGLPPSYHGSPSHADESMRVHAEFGADLWCYVFEAGFKECRIATFYYPSGIALTAIS